MSHLNMSNMSESVQMAMDKLGGYWTFLYVDGADPRVADWPLMATPIPTFFLMFSYVYIVMYLGPRVMKNRKPFRVEGLMILYNAFQVVFNSWIWVECMIYMTMYDYNMQCQPVDYSTSPRAMKTTLCAYLFYISKLVDFLDTLFFIVRKRFQHVSKLHVIHHTLMPFGCWYCVKFFAGGHAAFLACCNSFVHAVMYSYYLIAALGPRYQKYLWWKRQLTMLQMVQFLVVMLHGSQLFFIECDFPLYYGWWCLATGLLFFLMFYDFYIKSYIHPKKKDGHDSKKKNDNQFKNGSVSERTKGDLRKRNGAKSGGKLQDVPNQSMPNIGWVCGPGLDHNS